MFGVLVTVSITSQTRKFELKKECDYMDSIKVILAGIVLILVSLFCMGICILNANKGGPQGLTVCLFAAGIIVSIMGLFFVKDEE